MTEQYKITHEEIEGGVTVRVKYGSETVLFTYKPQSREVSFKFGTGESEERRESEPQEITIEGRIARNRWAKYDKDKHTYSNRLAYQPDASNNDLAWYYDVEAVGEAADQAYGLYLNQAGMGVVVSGVLVKEDVSDKTKGVIKADFIARLPGGQKPSHTIQRERIQPERGQS